MKQGGTYLGQTSCSHHNLTDFTHTAKLGVVVSVDNEELYIFNTLSSWDDIAKLVQCIGVFGVVLDGVVGHTAARLSGTIRSANVCVGSQLAESSAILLGQDITNVQHPLQGRTFCRGASHQNLTHGWRKMGCVGLMVTEPLRQLVVSNILSSGYYDFGAQKQRREEISLDGIVTDTTTLG